MKNRRFIILGILIVAISIVGKLLWSAMSNVKIDDFKPAAVIFLVDSSASNQKALADQKQTLKQICNLLDPEDQVKILR